MAEVVTTAEFARLAAGGGFRELLDQMWSVGGCSSPVFLVGHSLSRDAATGKVVHVFTSSSQARGLLAVACGNRRESRCPACAWLHHGDTYQIVLSGLAGGKGVPEQVAEHPRLMVTLTAPGFGTVHRVTQHGVCHWALPAQSRWCEHGVSRVCLVRHTADDPRVGLAMCEECYRAGAAVLWNANVGRLWDRFVVRVRREVAAYAGIPASRLGEYARISFAKVAEFQRRGSVHLHAVIRADGADGPGEVPPDWLTAGVLRDAVIRAVPWAQVPVPSPTGEGEVVLRFGSQVDAQVISSVPGDGGSDGWTESKVGYYLAKYVSKGDPAGLVVDHRLRSAGEIEATPMSRQARVLMREAWALGELPQFADLRLQEWAHQLGYRGTIASKSRAYSVTYKSLRAERVAYRQAERGVVPYPGPVVTESRWQFDHQGYTPTERSFADSVARDVLDRRRGKGGGRGE